MHKKKPIITLLGICFFTLGAFGVLVWGLNTVSQNKTLTTKFIKFQIHRLLDLESEVENPHAYLDWDLHYKIRADRLSFIHEGSDIVTADNIKLNVFLPEMLLKRIYITQMNFDNLFVDFERYEDGKINIIEIFNITSFFKIHFKNSAISVNKYYFKVTDNFHKPAEKMYISGDNILISKFTLNRYLQLIMDGNLDYKNRVTPFAISYSAKIPTITKDFNIEAKFPDFDAGIFSSYINEFAPDTTFSAKGSADIKISDNKFINLDSTVHDVKIKSPKLPVSFDFDDKISIFTRFAYENKNFIIDQFDVKGKDFETSTYGRVFDISSLPLNIDLYIKVKENSNGNSIMKILPWGLPAMNYAVDKVKKHNAGAIVAGEAHAKGKIGYLDIFGHADAKDVNLGYGFDFPSSTASIDFKGEKMYIDGIYYPNKNPNQYTKINGNIKIKKPIYLDLHTSSSPVLDMVSGQKALNIASDIFNFSTGPVALMNVKKGLGTVPSLDIKATPPNVYLTGTAKFWDGEGSMPGLYGEVEKVSGEVVFNGKDIEYKNIKGLQDGTWGYAHGKTEIHNNALTHFYLHIPAVSLVLAKHYIDNSPLIKQISTSLRSILDPKGIAEISFVLISDKNMTLPETEGFVAVENGSCNIEGLAYRAKNVTGRVDFNTYRSLIDFDGIVHGVKTKLTGTAETHYSDLLIVTPDADVKSAHEFFVNSPMFADMKDSMKDFSDFSGKIRTETKLYGDLSKNNGDFITKINIKNGTLKYLDIPKPVVLTGGNVTASREKVVLKDLTGNILDTPFILNGFITDAGTKKEKDEIKLEMKDFPVANVKEFIGTKIFTPEANELLSEFSYKTGTVDIVSYVDEKKNPKANLQFKDAQICYKKTNAPIIAKSGNMFFSNDVLKFNDVDVQMTSSKFLIDGTINDYEKNPILNVDLTSNITGKDFNSIIAPLFNLPISLAGEIYTNVNFVGSMDNWRAKMRAMLDDNSSITYKNANIGAGLSKFMFFDVNGNKKDIMINTLDVFSPNADPSATEADILAQMYGKIKDINTTNPSLEKFHLKLNDYMNISFLNILLYDPDKPEPFLTGGKIKGDISLDGGLNNLSILGKAQVLDAVIPSINTTIEKMDVKFNHNYISTDDTIINIAGSKASISALLENKFTLPIAIEKLALNSDLINFDNIMKSFNSLFAQDEDIQNNKDKSKIQKAKTPPVTINKGKIAVKEFIHNGLLVNNFSADFKIAKDWNCEIKNIFASVADGTVVGDVIYNFYTTALKAKVAAENVMANVIAATFLNLPNEIYGHIDANAEFLTKGQTHEQLINNMDGTASFKLKDGRMLRLGSVEYMLRVANTFKGGLTRLNLNAIVNLVAPRTGYFDTVEGDFKIQNGMIYTDRITSKSSELNLFMTGMYNMNNSYVNGTIIGQMPMESKESILWLGSLGRISLNSLVKQLTREANKDNDDAFFYDPIEYVNAIPGLQNNKGDYRFFVVSLKGNLYTDKYVDEFKWIK